MKLYDVMNEYFKRIKEHEARDDKEQSLVAGECYFFDKNDILDYGKDFGNSRYPYSRDGLTLWAYSSGYIMVEESTLMLFPDVSEGREARLAFFAGESCKDGYFPISLTGVGKQLFESDVSRYTVFTPYATYYLTESKTLRSAVRVFLDKSKCLRFSVCVSNKSDKAQKTYACAYYNMLLQTVVQESESKWYKKVAATDSGFTFSKTEHFSRNVCFERYGEIARSCVSAELDSTTSHADFCGGYNNQLQSATSLKDGCFKDKKPHTTFNETPIAADIMRFTLEPGESFEVSYSIAIGTDPCEISARVNKVKETADIDRLLEEMQTSPAEIYKQIPDIRFSELESLDASKFNSFINNVFKQAEFCARAKNYAGPFIGIRDIFQQLEAAIMWIPEYSRSKIVEAMGYIGDDGRAPRQYSYPYSKDVPPEMDLRPFIDQGNWIITTVYEYLCFTGDTSLLDEICGYYKLSNRVDFSDRRDSVLCHLVAIVDYLLSNLDEETGCLRALYGDWNDALDGLGRTKRTDVEYGNGVSVMATLHLYQNLYEICEILKAVGGQDALIEKYTRARERIGKGVLEYAVEKGDGQRKILHGWGENRSYKIGSFCDNDKENRDSLTSNAFFILSGALNLDRSLKNDVLAAYSRLDSKYGFKTFEPYFAKTNEDVGRIVKLPRGTAENAATYIHATLFAIWSLFRIGEARLAWEQIYKILPITHSFISTSPFVMPNSYIHNEDELLDGESMSDWFTGSGCVLAKVLVREAFGIEPTLDKIEIAPASYIPAKECSITVSVKGVNVTLVYKNEGVGKRSFKVNGTDVESYLDESRGVRKIALKPECDYVVEVTD